MDEDLIKTVVAALREASCFDIPWAFREHLQETARKLEAEPDWKTVATALCVKYGTAKGTALLGNGTLKWAKDKVMFEVIPDPSAVVLNWSAPSLKPAGS